MNKPRVLVFLSTYNGEKYLPEQIDSIFNQKDVDVFLMATDDCSSDSTHELLQKYKKEHANFDYRINEVNKRFTYNFLDLFFDCKDRDYDYYAFADQDDVWLENKLVEAIKKIKEKKSSKGVLYCSRLTTVDENLKEIEIQNQDFKYDESRYSPLSTNIATGCTVVMDRTFFKKATEYYPKDIYLHDYWFYLIANYVCDFVYDTNSYILYRQHGDNQIGFKKPNGFKAKLKNFFKKGNSYIPHLCYELREGYKNDISEEDLKYISLMADYKKKFGCRLKLVFSRKVRRKRSNFFFKLKILFGKF